MTPTPIRPLCQDCGIKLKPAESKLCEQCQRWWLVYQNVAATKALLEKTPRGR